MSFASPQSRCCLISSTCTCISNKQQGKVDTPSFYVLCLCNDSNHYLLCDALTHCYASLLTLECFHVGRVGSYDFEDGRRHSSVTRRTRMSRASKDEGIVLSGVGAVLLEVERPVPNTWLHRMIWRKILRSQKLMIKCCSSHLLRWFSLAWATKSFKSCKQFRCKWGGALISPIFAWLISDVCVFVLCFHRYNYPNYLNLYTTLVYIPTSFAYIIPMARAGKISQEQMTMSKRPFMIMGGLDALAGIMQVFAATYLPGALIILLLQVRNKSNLWIATETQIWNVLLLFIVCHSNFHGN